jgi:hypothetical protein
MARYLGHVCKVGSAGAGRPDRIALPAPDLSTCDYDFGRIDGMTGRLANVLPDVGQDHGKVARTVGDVASFSTAS